MSQQSKPDVHLEVYSGFFRIPTESVVYNITVMDSQDVSTTHRMNDIVKDKISEVAPQRSQPSQVFAAGKSNNSPVSDPFYKDAALYYSEEFRRLAGKLSEEVEEGQNGIGEGDLQTALTEKLTAISQIAAEAKRTVADLQEGDELAEAPQVVAEEHKHDQFPFEQLTDVQENTAQIKQIIGAVLESGAVDSPPVEEVAADGAKTTTRYLFDLDVVFQTIYELCTNETVKEHSQNARAKAAEIFDTEIFLDYVSERVKSYSEDDGFLSVPLADVLEGLSKGCSDKKILNLLKNMNKQQADIFLDQFLPLETPPTEEIAAAGEKIPAEVSGDGEKQEEVASSADPRLNEAMALINSLEVSLQSLAGTDVKEDTPAAAVSVAIPEAAMVKLVAVSDLLGSIESQIEALCAEIGADSQQPLSGTGLQGLIVEIRKSADSLATSLAQKNDKPELSFSNLKRLNSLSQEDGVNISSELPVVEDEIVADQLEVAEEHDVQGDVDKVIFDSTPKDDLDEQQELSEDVSDVSANEGDDDFGEASQDDIDKLLEEMGG